LKGINYKDDKDDEDDNESPAYSKKSEVSSKYRGSSGEKRMSRRYGSDDEIDSYKKSKPNRKVKLKWIFLVLLVKKIKSINFK